MKTTVRIAGTKLAQHTAEGLAPVLPEVPPNKRAHRPMIQGEP